MEQIIKNRYKVIRSIGSGGMSEVFLAHDELLDRDVAVKRLRDQFVTDKALLTQFNREAKSAARLVHPNIIGIYDVIDDGKDQYIVMEYVEGQTLKDILAEYQIDTKAAMQITMQLAEALQRAHDNKVVHCDIKPQNILIGNDMVPKIADFGIAKMVSGQTMVYSKNVMGSVYYISPEQASGETVTAASDIYSLGIVLYEMLTGEVPFKGNTPVSVAMMQVEKPLPALSEHMEFVPKGLQTVLDLMTAKKPGNRYAHAKDVAVALQKILDADAAGTARDDAMGNTLVMAPVPQGGKGKIFAVSLNKEAMAAKAKNWQEAVELYFKNFQWNFDNSVIVLTLVVCFISLLAHIFFKTDNAMVEVPDVVTMQVEEAQNMLKGRNYEVVLQEESSAEVEVGKVIRQVPKAGEKRRHGSTVKVVFSVGAEKHIMPDLEDMSLVKAQTTLDELGMKVGTVEHKYNSGYRIGVVIEQDPKPGEKTDETVAVKLVINEGDIQLPSLVGMQVGEAERLLRQMGLRVGEIRRVNSMDIKGTVTATYPESGMKLPGYYPVRLTVSDGADSSVVGAKFEYEVPGPNTEAHRIQIYRVDKKGRNLIYSSTDNGGKVIRQTIGGAGGSVTIVVYCDGKQVQESSF